MDLLTAWRAELKPGSPNEKDVKVVTFRTHHHAFDDDAPVVTAQLPAQDSALARFMQVVFGAIMCARARAGAARSMRILLPL
jgi:hypothetical protein